MAIGDRFFQGKDNLSPISEICDSKSHPTSNCYIAKDLWYDCPFDMGTNVPFDVFLSCNTNL